MHAPKTTTIHHWLDRIQAGDLTARDELLRAVSDRVEYLARRLLKRYPGLRRWMETDDVLNDGLLRLSQALTTIRPDNTRAFYALSAAVIRNRLRDLARRYFGPHGLATHHDSDAAAVDRAATPREDDLDFAAFHEEAARLPDDYRDVFNLCYYHGLGPAAAAEILGISSRTVDRRWARAKIYLYQALHDLGHAPAPAMFKDPPDGLDHAPE
jgi:RNA polymerase sigma-70 factor (ECF subfamily)